MKKSILLFLLCFLVACAGSSYKVNSSFLAKSDSMMAPSEAGFSDSGPTTKTAASFDDTKDKSNFSANIASPPEDTIKILENEIQSGSLTAGSFDDNLYPKTFRKFIDQVDQSLGTPLFEWGQHIIIQIENSQQQPIGNASVAIYNAQSGEHLFVAPTGSNGRVTFVSGWDVLGASDFRVEVSTMDNLSATQYFSLNDATWRIVIEDAQQRLPNQLDVAFVIDATGSMQDEMAYLQVESAHISKAIKQQFPNTDIKFALIVYRDNGDEYVTRKFDFETLQQFFHNLSVQRADGGGDYPEAMHKALQESVTLSWRSQNTARLLFLIADAPPHDQEMKQTIAHVNALRKLGVKIYPIAASGVAEKAEYIMRIASFLTLAEYIFLTDDSGIGNSHAEPHIPFYYVQKLNVLITRMIASELAGRKFLPHPEQILRVSGNPNFATE